MTGVIEQLSAAALAAAVKRRALALGFDLAGIASAEPSRHRDYVRQWLDDGKAGTMHYLARRFEERVDPGVYLPGARSVVCVAMNYQVPLAPPAEAPEDRGRIARYALGDDYHETMKPRLLALADWLSEQMPDARTRASVDTAPVLERELAGRSGIGWVGKNGCIIHPGLGSWLLLGQVITTADLPADEPITDHCGSCTRCLDACPTDAFDGPYQLDPRKCISFLTIESREAAPPALLKNAIGDWLYGCDVCQEVCPHNAKAPPATDEAAVPRFGSGTISARSVVEWSDQDYRTKLKGSAMKRVKLPMLKRNAEIVMGNLAAAEADGTPDRSHDRMDEEAR